MRIVSWMVVITSIGALSWMGLSPLLSNLDLNAVDPDYAVGTTVANTARASLEVAQAELIEHRCEETEDGAAGRDAHQDPAARAADKKNTPNPACKP